MNQGRPGDSVSLCPARTENGGQELMTITEWTPSVDIFEDPTALLMASL